MVWILKHIYFLFINPIYQFNHKLLLRKLIILKILQAIILKIIITIENIFTNIFNYFQIINCQF